MSAAERWEQLPEWMRGHQLATIPEESSNNDADYDAEHVKSDDIEEAHIVLSVDTEGTLHRPVLDIDFPAALIPSSTPGHFHLYLDKPMTARKYMRLLDALADAGIVEQGYASVSDARGYTSVRLPWVKKKAAA